MTARDDFDLVLGEWFEASARAADPVGLHDGAIRRARGSRQRPRWLAGLGGGFPAARSGYTARYASLLGLIAVLVGGAMVWSVLPAGTPHPTATASASASPSASALATPLASVRTERAEWFVVPFDYAIPAGSGLVTVARANNQHIVRWALPAEHGITVAAGEQPWAHGANGRFDMAGEPDNVLGRLRELAGLDGPVTSLELDGRPALAVTVDDPGATDIHVGEESLPYRNYIQLNKPSLMIVANVSGNVVFVMIWARTTEELDAFMPTAMQFVNSIHFVER